MASLLATSVDSPRHPLRPIPPPIPARSESPASAPGQPSTSFPVDSPIPRSRSYTPHAHPEAAHPSVGEAGEDGEQQGGAPPPLPPLPYFLRPIPPLHLRVNDVPHTPSPTRPPPPAVADGYQADVASPSSHRPSSPSTPHAIGSSPSPPAAVTRLSPAGMPPRSPSHQPQSQLYSHHPHLPPLNVNTTTDAAPSLSPASGVTPPHKTLPPPHPTHGPSTSPAAQSRRFAPPVPPRPASLVSSPITPSSLQSSAFPSPSSASSSPSSVSSPSAVGLHAMAFSSGASPSHSTPFSPFHSPHRPPPSPFNPSARPLSISSYTPSSYIGFPPLPPPDPHRMERATSAASALPSHAAAPPLSSRSSLPSPTSFHLPPTPFSLTGPYSQYSQVPGLSFPRLESDSKSKEYHFHVQCGVMRVPVVVGEAYKGTVHPLNYQAQWWRRVMGVEVDRSFMDQLARLVEQCHSSRLSFPERCRAMFGDHEPLPAALPVLDQLTFLPRQGMRGWLEQLHRTTKEWYDHGERRGRADSLYRLGESFASATGSMRCDAEAVRAFQQAAAMNEPRAMARLGRYLYYGERGLQADMFQACDLTLRAAALGDPSAYHLLSVMFDSNGRMRFLVLDNMKPRYLQQAKAGHLMAKAVIAFLALLDDDHLIARNILREAPDALKDSTGYLLGRWYDAPSSPHHPEPAIARRYYEEAADAGNLYAAVRLAQLHSMRGGEESEALLWYERAAERGSAEAQGGAALLYWRGVTASGAGGSAEYGRAAELTRLHLTGVFVEDDDSRQQSVNHIILRTLARNCSRVGSAEEAAALYTLLIDDSLQAKAQPSPTDLAELAELYYEAQGELTFDDDLPLHLCNAALVGREDGRHSSAAMACYVKGRLLRRPGVDPRASKACMMLAIAKLRRRVKGDTRNVDAAAHYYLGLIVKGGYLSSVEAVKLEVSGDAMGHFTRAIQAVDKGDWWNEDIRRRAWKEMNDTLHTRRAAGGGGGVGERG